MLFSGRTIFTDSERAAGEGCLPCFQHYSWLTSEERHGDGPNDSPAFCERAARLSGALWSIAMLLPLSVFTVPFQRACWVKWGVTLASDNFSIPTKIKAPVTSESQGAFTDSLFPCFIPLAERLRACLLACILRVLHCVGSSALYFCPSRWRPREH